MYLQIALRGIHLVTVGADKGAEGRVGVPGHLVALGALGVHPAMPHIWAFVGRGPGCSILTQRWGWWGKLV